MTAVEPPVLRAFLLRTLDPATRDALESRLMTDEALLSQLRAAEDDLRDDHARGALTPAERAAFETALMATPADRARQRFARALAARIARDGPRAARPATAARRRVAWRAALGLAAMLAIAVAGWRFAREHREPMPTYAVFADERRGAAARVLALPATPTTARLQVELSDDAGGGPYRLAIVDGTRVVFDADALAPRAVDGVRFVEVTVPTPALGPGSRVITVAASADATRVATRIGIEGVAAARSPEAR